MSPSTPVPGQEEFVVELPIFSGPFKLLGELILDQKVDVCDVPVARITDEFLRRGRAEVGRWTLEEATWFLAVCATLLELKVGRLMPRRSEPESEEDLLPGVSPDLLYARSLELAAFRRIAGDLAERMDAAALLVGRTGGPPPELAHLYPDPLGRVTAKDLRDLARLALTPPPAIDLSHISPIVFSIGEAMERVRERLTAAREVRFRDLIDHDMERIHVVVHFLALLELHRQGHVDLLQGQLFGEIQVRWQEAQLEGSSPSWDPEEWGEGRVDPSDGGGASSGASR